MAVKTEAGKELLIKSELLQPDIVQRYTKKLRLHKGAQIRTDHKDAIEFFKRRVSKDTRFGKGRINELFKKQYYKQIDPEALFTGRMYLFNYQAEMDDLWDALPLTFMFGRYKSNDGFTILQGLNLHHLPPTLRAKLLLELLKLKTSKGKSEKTRLKLSWQMIKSVSKSKAYMACVRSYRIDRIKSNMAEIGYNSWSVVTFLQIARFVQGNRKQAYADSLNKIQQA